MCIVKYSKPVFVVLLCQESNFAAYRLSLLRLHNSVGMDKRYFKLK